MEAVDQGIMGSGEQRCRITLCEGVAGMRGMVTSSASRVKSSNELSE